MSDQTDWLSYLEAEPQTEPYLSIAKAWRIDRSNLCLAEEGLANYEEEVQAQLAIRRKRDEEIERLKAHMRNVAGWLNNGCEPAKGAAELLLIAGLPQHPSGEPK